MHHLRLSALILVLLVCLLQCSVSLGQEVLAGGWWNSSCEDLQMVCGVLKEQLEGKDTTYALGRITILVEGWQTANNEELSCAISQLENQILSLEKYNKPTANQSMAPSKPAVSSKSSSSYSSSSSFTNRYGTSTTRCAHLGCSNYIASTGDTNCCTTHSRKCLQCGKYIDEDGTYCMDCIKSAVAKTAQSNGRRCDASDCTNTANKVLLVTQPNGDSESIFLCTSHYYKCKDFFNSKPGWSAY